MLKFVVIGASLALLTACNSGGETIATPEGEGNLADVPTAKESLDEPVAPAATEAAEVIGA